MNLAHLDDEGVELGDEDDAIGHGQGNDEAEDDVEEGESAKSVV